MKKFVVFLLKFEQSDKTINTVMMFSLKTLKEPNKTIAEFANTADSDETTHNEI